MNKAENRINYRKLFLEGLLIFVSITLAIALENLNENRKENQKERDFLISIDKELERHITLYKREKLFEIKVLNSMNQILEVIENKTPYHDSLGAYFSNYLFYGGERLSSPVYESLKSSGIDLIKDHDLRIKIASYYESPSLTLPLLSDINTYNYIFNAVPFHTDNFETTYDSYLSGENMAAVPVDYDKLIRDPKFKNMLSFYVFWRITMIDRYTQWIEEAELLKEEIKVD